jgi:hypothetical protein
MTVLLDLRINGTSLRESGGRGSSQKAGLGCAVYRAVTSAE